LLVALTVLTVACSNTTGATRAARPTGTAAPPPTSATTSPARSTSSATASVNVPVSTPTSGAPDPTCVQGWRTVTPGTDDYRSAALLLPQIQGARVVRVFTGPLPGTGTGLHVYARTGAARLLAVQMGDGPAVILTAPATTANWRPTDWHRTGAAPAQPNPSDSAGSVLPASQAGCLDGS
jgi:hypothetical protein